MERKKTGASAFGEVGVSPFFLLHKEGGGEKGQKEGEGREEKGVNRQTVSTVTSR